MYGRLKEKYSSQKMAKQYIEDKTFEKVDFTLKKIVDADYESCVFIGCDLSNADLSGLNLTDCQFMNCNLSSAKLSQTTFSDVQFTDSKMLGLHFEDCNEFIFSAIFDNCILNFSSFYKRKLKKILFKDCILQEVDFTESDLSNSVFKNCDLKAAKFENTVLERADLTTAFNYSINPDINRIKRAKFSYPGVIGLLDKYDIDLQ